MTDSLVTALRTRVSQHPQREALIFLEADGRAAAYSTALQGGGRHAFFQH